MSMLASRQTFRNLIIIACLLLLGVSYFAFRYGQGIQAEIQTRDFERVALLQELENTARLSANLAELNSLTISEAAATRLNIMRHLGLEQENYDFEVVNRQITQAGTTELYTRQASLRTMLSYGATLNLIDRLYNTGKIAIQKIELRANTSIPGERVEMSMVGNIYALRKEGQEETVPHLETKTETAPPMPLLAAPGTAPSATVPASVTVPAAATPTTPVSPTTGNTPS